MVLLFLTDYLYYRKRRMKSKKNTLGFYMVPLTVINKIKEKPEVALFLLVKMYEKIYPKATDEKIYDAIMEYLCEIDFTPQCITQKELKAEDIN
jgi:hypothetical protein